MTDRKPEDVRALIARAREFRGSEIHGMANTLADACEQLLDLVRRLQWAGGGVRGDCCYLCGETRPGLVGPSQHVPDCPIAALGLPAEDE